MYGVSNDPYSPRLIHWHLKSRPYPHHDVIKWKHFPRYRPFVWGIHRSLVNSPHKGPVMRSFDVFFDLRLNKRLSKQSQGWWFETPSCPLWRHRNVSGITLGKHTNCPSGNEANLKDGDKCIICIKKNDKVRQNLVHVYLTFSTPSIILASYLHCW